MFKLTHFLGKFVWLIISLCVAYNKLYPRWHLVLTSRQIDSISYSQLTGYGYLVTHLKPSYGHTLSYQVFLVPSHLLSPRPLLGLLLSQPSCTLLLWCFQCLHQILLPPERRGGEGIWREKCNGGGGGGGGGGGVREEERAFGERESEVMKI